MHRKEESYVVLLLDVTLSLEDFNMPRIEKYTRRQACLNCKSLIVLRFMFNILLWPSLVDVCCMLCAEPPCQFYVPERIYIYYQTDLIFY